tara:strand:- start:115 stop:579 length:465 start_codon:yes stop_codon:yes gene_type:complete
MLGQPRDIFLARLSIQIVANTIAVIIAEAILHPNIQLPDRGSIDYWMTALAFGAILALLNGFLRPALYLLFAPLSCIFMVLTFGLGHFFLGALMFWLAGEFIGPVQVAGFGYALLGAITASLTGTITNHIFQFNKSDFRIIVGKTQDGDDSKDS